MKTSTILTALGGMLAFNAQVVNAGCYTTGDPWPNKDQAAQFVWDACYGSQGMFSGQFRPKQTKSMCPRSGQLGLVFELKTSGARRLTLITTTATRASRTRSTDVTAAESQLFLSGVSVLIPVTVKC
ncbi:hypothetical protein FOXG_13589 [Fusarium oxysporum f. sp. lycopersici 4287]|uniref:Uncharacterized protein n=2 Tax=Fusarium oxysporum TaxID=5507 RepID=A0A0J9VW56_FUSO4|nr:hypothetical protein FOXG_13589 [Fusarium oxysporum f. sp. lycopersici 4287]KNB14820.1 hypothetical protein FOXG_13589 [Fusarium oxysporum f. sp. lycopersici 4287]